MQIVRMFVIPAAAHTAKTLVAGEEVMVMTDGTFTKAIVYLAVSAAALLFSAVLNFIRCSALEAHVKSLENSKA